MKLEQIHLFVSGRVQGVGFRYATQRQAQSLGLSGWVKNTESGQVEILAQGPSDTLDVFLEWCKRGPSGARVSSLELTTREGLNRQTLGSFEITF